MDEDSLVEGMKELMPVYCVIGKIPVCRTDKIPLGTKGRTSILSIESSASCGASFSVSRKRLHDRACFVTSFRQGGYTPPCAAKAAIPCGLAVRKQHEMLFAASKFEGE